VSTSVKVLQKKVWPLFSGHSVYSCGREAIAICRINQASEHCCKVVLLNIQISQVK